MRRLSQRLLEGDRPLRVGELAGLVGYSSRHLRRMFDSGRLRFVSLPGSAERRIPTDEARRLVEAVQKK